MSIVFADFPLDYSWRVGERGEIFERGEKREEFMRSFGEKKE